MSATTRDRAVEWYTMESAAKNLGVSTKTMRRWTHDITSNPKHALRKHFKPAPAKVREFKDNKKTFTWEFNGIALDAIVTERHGNGRKSTSSAGESSTTGSRDLVDYLKRQNAKLEDELKAEREHNRKMQEEQLKLQQTQAKTQGQTNELLKQMSDRLQLPESTSQTDRPGVINVGVGESTSSNATRIGRLRAILTKEIHIPLIPRQ